MLHSSQINSAVTGGFWARWKQLNQNTVLPYQLRVLWGKEPGLTPEQESPVIRNFLIAAGRSSAVYQGEGFYDSDLAKWLEAASHTMRRSADEALDRESDTLIDLVAETQCEDDTLEPISKSLPRSKGFSILDSAANFIASVILWRPLPRITEPPVKKSFSLWPVKPPTFCVQKLDQARKNRMYTMATPKSSWD